MVDNDLVIEKKFNGNRCDVKIKGSIDTAASVEFERTLSSIPKSVSCLVLDFSVVAYICSTGLRVLLKIHKEMVSRGGVMELRNLPELVMEVLEATGLSKLLSINPLP